MGLHSPAASLPQRCDSYMPDQGILSAGACMRGSFSIDLLSQKRVVREPEYFTMARVCRGCGEWHRREALSPNCRCLSENLGFFFDVKEADTISA